MMFHSGFPVSGGQLDLSMTSKGHLEFPIARKASLDIPMTSKSPTSGHSLPHALQTGPALCEDGRPFVTDPLTGRQVCLCNIPALAEGGPYPPRSLSSGTEGLKTSQLPPSVTAASLGYDASAFYSPLQVRGLPFRPERLPAYIGGGVPGQPPLHIDPVMAAHPYGLLYAGMDLNGGAMRKAATRETTGPLKAWLGEHKKNPYPTKAEKIMLAIITRMTLTQVSTWFANARRRLKKENKLYGGDRGDDRDDDNDDDDDDVGSRREDMESENEGGSGIQGQDTECMRSRMTDADNEDINVDSSDESDDEKDSSMTTQLSLTNRGAHFLHPNLPNGSAFPTHEGDPYPLNGQRKDFPNGNKDERENFLYSNERQAARQPNPDKSSFPMNTPERPERFVNSDLKASNEHPESGHSLQQTPKRRIWSISEIIEEPQNLTTTGSYHKDRPEVGEELLQSPVTRPQQIFFHPRPWPGMFHLPLTHPASLSLHHHLQQHHPTSTYSLPSSSSPLMSSSLLSTARGVTRISPVASPSSTPPRSTSPTISPPMSHSNALFRDAQLLKNSSPRASAFKAVELSINTSQNIAKIHSIKQEPQSSLSYENYKGVRYPHQYSSQMSPPHINHQSPSVASESLDLRKQSPYSTPEKKHSSFIVETPEGSSVGDLKNTLVKSPASRECSANISPLKRDNSNRHNAFEHPVTKSNPLKRCHTKSHDSLNEHVTQTSPLKQDTTTTPHSATEDHVTDGHHKRERLQCSSPSVCTSVDTHQSPTKTPVKNDNCEKSPTKRDSISNTVSQTPELSSNQNIDHDSFSSPSTMSDITPSSHSQTPKSTPQKNSTEVRKSHKSPSSKLLSPVGKQDRKSTGSLSGGSDCGATTPSTTTASPPSSHCSSSHSRSLRESKEQRTGTHQSPIRVTE